MNYLIVGLGNIGAEYELSRHNIGFLVLDQLADQHNVDFQLKKLGDFTDFKFKGRKIHLLKPNTYMNLSGKAVRYWMQELKVPLERLLVITDDLSLPFGKIRLKPSGSAGGHNGLKSIQDLLATSNYNRLRFGIGNDFHKGQQVEHVLSPFNKEELEAILSPIHKACEAILSFCSIGIERTMNGFN